MNKRIQLILLLALFAMPVLLNAQQPTIWAEPCCTNCDDKTMLYFSQTFDHQDYEFFGYLFDEWPNKMDTLYYRAPSNPNDICGSTWLKDMPFEKLHKQMPTLRKDTYDSFIARNRYVAEHATNSFATPSGRTIRIVKTRKNEFSLTRVGFSHDMQQALICDESMGFLYEKSGNRWKQVAEDVRWVP